MTLDEAIKHCEEKAKEQKAKAVGYFNGGYSSQIEGKSCLKCAEEHEQLAGWLKELKDLKEKSLGEWINVNGDGSLWKCSICGEQSCCRGKYCPDCGLKMRNPNL